MTDDFRLGGLTSYLVRAQEAYCTEQLRHYHIMYGQFPVLRALYRGDSINQDTLAKRLLFNKATIARAIDKLEQAGYVTRTRDESDRRANRISLTPEGWEIKPAMDRISHDWNMILLSGLTDVEALMLKELMKKIVSGVMSEMEQEDMTVISELMK
jgi:DNA-binding MarR family transcriptional regulator